MISEDLAHFCHDVLAAQGYQPLRSHLYGRCVEGVLQTVHFQYGAQDSYVWHGSLLMADPSMMLQRSSPGTGGRRPPRDAALRRTAHGSEALLSALKQQLIDHVLPAQQAASSVERLIALMAQSATPIANYRMAFGHFQLQQWDQGRACLDKLLSDRQLDAEPGLALLGPEREHAAELLKASAAELQATVRQLIDANVRRHRLARVLKASRTN